MVSWQLWLAGSALLFIHAYAIADEAFMAIQAVDLIAVSVTLYYAKKYEANTCLACQIKSKPRTTGKNKTQ